MKLTPLLLGLFLTLTIQSAEAAPMNTTQELPLRQQQIAKIASYTASGDIDNLKQALNDGLDNGLTVNEIKEVLVQMYAYTGFPRSLNAIGAFMQVSADRKAQGKTDADGEIGKALPQTTDKRSYGNNVQIELTGREVKGGAMDFAPAIDSFLKEHLFADIFGRGVLSYQDREVATISALSTLEGVDSQLNSHINIGKNVGLTDDQIKEITTPTYINIDTIFKMGDKNPYGQYFTGQTYLNMLSQNDDVFNAPLGNVTFEPGARTNWHRHSGGQILLVTAGEGRYQEKDKEIQVLKKGDVVRIAPNVVHWHGAAPDSWFNHISVETNVPNNQVTWLEPVTDAEYK